MKQFLAVLSRGRKLVTNHANIETIIDVSIRTIKQRAPGFVPRIGIILGSGLSQFAENIQQSIKIPYKDLLGFPQVSVQGHGNQLVLGMIHNIPVMCLLGRAHPYEGPHALDAIKVYVRTLKALGCHSVIITNASGSLKEDMEPGSIMLITDHINMQPINPLIGPNDDKFGPRFYPLDNIYDPELRELALAAANAENIQLHQGTYMAVSGPNYETAAEIRAFRLLGADAVGMSTVPEVLVAAHCGLKVCAFATITNFATGLSKQTPHSHEEVLKTATLATIKLNKLLQNLIHRL